VRESDGELDLHAAARLATTPTLKPEGAGGQCDFRRVNGNGINVNGTRNERGSVNELTARETRKLTTETGTSTDAVPPKKRFIFLSKKRMTPHHKLSVT